MTKDLRALARIRSEAAAFEKMMEVATFEFDPTCGFEISGSECQKDLLAAGKEFQKFHDARHQAVLGRFGDLFAEKVMITVA